MHFTSGKITPGENFFFFCSIIFSQSFNALRRHREINERLRVEGFQWDIDSKGKLFLPDQELPTVIPILSLTLTEEEKESHTNPRLFDMNIRNTLLQGCVHSDVSILTSGSNYWS